MMRGNRFLLSTFDGSLTCAAEVWVKKLEAFFLLHPIVDREVIEVVVLHLEGEAKIWWFSHWDHARVSTLVDFSQILIRRFGQRREEPSPPVEEAHTSVVIVMEEQPSSIEIETSNTIEEETLAATQDSSKNLQGMPKFLFLMEGCISLHADFLEQEVFTTL